MDLIFENKDRNIKIYKFLNIIDKNSSIGNILLNGLLHWNSINDQEILNIKNIITNKNINVKGYTTKDTIVLLNDEQSIHYYAYFDNNNIEIWYIDGIYETPYIDDNLTFKELLFILQN